MCIRDSPLLLIQLKSALTGRQTRSLPLAHRATILVLLATEQLAAPGKHRVGVLRRLTLLGCVKGIVRLAGAGIEETARVVLVVLQQTLPVVSIRLRSLLREGARVLNGKREMRAYTV